MDYEGNAIHEAPYKILLVKEPALWRCVNGHEVMMTNPSDLTFTMGGQAMVLRNRCFFCFKEALERAFPEMEQVITP
mgnify:CR=1 FL=1